MTALTYVRVVCRIERYFSRLVHMLHDFPADLHLPLETYMRSYPKVRIVRSTERVGLIRARLMGVAAAKGPVLTFLDSHVEASPGLRPNRKSFFACAPTSINDTVFSYEITRVVGASAGSDSPKSGHSSVPSYRQH